MWDIFTLPETIPWASSKEHHDWIVSLQLKDENRGAPHYTDFSFGKGKPPLIAVLDALRGAQFKRAANIECAVKNVDPAKDVADAVPYVKPPWPWP